MGLSNDILSISLDKLAAAELALTYENLVDVLEKDLGTLRTYVDSLDARDDIEDMLDAIHKVKTGEYK